MGLLIWLVILAAVGYYGFEIGGVYWRQLKLEEAVKLRLAYAGQLTNEAIHQRVLDDIARMGLPSEARNATLVQTDRPRVLQLRISYKETVNLLFTTKKLPVSINMRRSF